MHAAQEPKSKLKFVTFDKESNMSTLWRQEEFPRICSKEELAEKAQDIEVTMLEEGHNRSIVRFAYLCHMIGEEFVFFPFLYIKLVELGVEVALNHRSAVTHHKINMLKF